MAVKKVLLKKKIGNDIYDIYAKTSADIVEYTPDGGSTTTVAAQLAAITASIGDGSVAEQIQALEDKIMGLSDGETLDQALDTIKELQDWIKNDTTGGAKLISDVSALKTAVGDSTSGLVKQVADLEGTVGDSTSGLVKDVSDLQIAVGDSNSGLVADVAQLQSDLSQLTADTAIAASGNNDFAFTVGTGATAETVTVFTENANKRLVSDAEKTLWNSKAAVVATTQAAMPDAANASDTDLYLVEITA